MNRQLSTSELDTLELAFPVLEPVMTRREKLLRLAHIVRNSGHNIFIFHRLEWMTDLELSREEHFLSAFASAAFDPVFIAEGLKGHDVLSAKKFFELTTEQLHEFSCDCGGLLTNEDMADRIEKLARYSY